MTTNLNTYSKFDLISISDCGSLFAENNSVCYFSIKSSVSSIIEDIISSIVNSCIYSSFLCFMTLYRYFAIINLDSNNCLEGIFRY